jgi:two-component system LytT family sensor kinase
MSQTQIAILTLGYLTGAVLFGLLLYLLIKVRLLTGTLSRGVWAAALGLLWNAGSLAALAAILGGLPSESLWHQIPDTAAWTATAFLPLTLMMMLTEGPGEARLPPHIRGLSYLVAVCIGAAFWGAAFVPGFPLSFERVMTISGYNLGAQLLVGIVFRRRAAATTLARRGYQNGLLLLTAGLALCVLTMIHFALGESWETALTICARLSSIPIALLSISSLGFVSHFRFADVFIKHSFVVLAAMLLAFAARLVVGGLAVWARGLGPYPEAAGLLSSAIIGAGLLLCFPALRRAINRAADRWLFRRPNYGQLIREFTLSLEEAIDEDELLERATAQLRAGFGLAEVGVVTPEEFGLIPDDGREVIYPTAADRARRAGGHPVDVLLPVRENARARYLLAIAPGGVRGSLLSDELTYLASAAERLGRRLEQLRFERERRAQELREARLQGSLTEAQLRALRAQLNPHFLFNALNTIADLIATAPDKAEQLIEQLAEIFRYVLARTGQTLITVREEFEFLKTYLQIEQARFGERLRIELTVAPQTADALILPLILQPLVENAVKHGLAARSGEGILRVCADGDDEQLRFIIEDDGIGWGQSDSRGAGVGLNNVTERLQTAYAGRAALQIDSEAGRGTRVTVTIPNDEAKNIDRGRRGGGPLAASEAARRVS